MRKPKGKLVALLATAAVAVVVILFRSGFWAYYAGEELPVRLLRWQGGESPEPSIRVVRNAETYRSLFKQGAADLRPRPSRDRVDFGGSQVVVVYWGSKPSTAYSLRGRLLTPHERRENIGLA